MVPAATTVTDRVGEEDTPRKVAVTVVDPTPTAVSRPTDPLSIRHRGHVAIGGRRPDGTGERLSGSVGVGAGGGELLGRADAQG